MDHVGADEVTSMMQMLQSWGTSQKEITDIEEIKRRGKQLTETAMQNMERILENDIENISLFTNWFAVLSKGSSQALTSKPSSDEKKVKMLMDLNIITELGKLMDAKNQKMGTTALIIIGLKTDMCTETQIQYLNAAIQDLQNFELEVDTNVEFDDDL